MANKPTSLIKKHLISTLALGTIAILVGWYMLTNPTAYPLGDKMVYLGKKDYGNILGFDYYPYSVYYYGTDMDEEELAGYFKSSLEHPIEDKGAYTDVYLTRDGVDFFLTYKTSSGFKTSKKHTVSITDEQYVLAKRFLDKKP